MTSLEHLCRCRGLSLGRINPTEDVLLPPDPEQGTLDLYIKLLDHYALRLLLREVIKARSGDDWKRGRRSVERFCSPEVVDGYLDQLIGLGVLTIDSSGIPKVNKVVRNFGDTYEWYVSRVLERDFGCQAVWGARFNSQVSGGDHDVISSLAGNLLYMEVKTSPPKHIESPEVTAFVKRLDDISPDIAVFHNDTHLRMKDKLVPLNWFRWWRRPLPASLQDQCPLKGSRGRSSTWEGPSTSSTANLTFAGTSMPCSGTISEPEAG
jgi:hypothetical protein